MSRPRTPLRFRLADLEPGAKLFGSCDRCLHIRLLNRVVLQRRLGLSFMLAHLARRTRCGRCLSNEVRLLMLAGDWARWYTAKEEPPS